MVRINLPTYNGNEFSIIIFPGGDIFCKSEPKKKTDIILGKHGTEL